MGIDYQKLISDSVDRLSHLLRERRRLDGEIERLQRLVRTTAIRFRSIDKGSIVAMQQNQSVGLTEAVCQVFELYDMELTPVMIRDLLPTLGFDTSRYKEPLTAIHVTLRRLLSRHVVTRTKAHDGSAIYIREKAPDRR